MKNCVVSTAPNKSIFYTNGIIGLTDKELAQIAQAISDSDDVTPATTEVWVSGFDRHITIGNTIVRKIDDAPYSFRLMGFNHYALTSPSAYGMATQTGKAGLLFQMVVPLPDLSNITTPSNNCSSWSNSSLRKTCGRLRKRMPVQTQSVLKQVRIPTAAKEDDLIVYVDDTLFVPSEYEVFGVSTYARVDEGVQYAWYAMHNKDIFRMKELDDWKDWWWTRSPCDHLDLSRSPDFCLVSELGTASSGDPAEDGGVVPCFCI